MAAVLQKCLDVLNDSGDLSDPRMKGFLVKSPLEFIGIIGLYLTLIYKLGPQFMKSRKQFSLRGVIIAYNLIQIVWNVVIFLMTLSLLEKMNLACTPPDTSNSKLNQLEVRVHYYYLLLKYFDLIETLFYVLRKKERQISFLHVYHHVGILVAAWVSGKYFPGGQAVFVALYNSLIHCIMYCYYLFTSWKPQSSGNVWWKKYVTLLQIVQHCMVFGSVFPAVVNWNCSYPKFWMGLFSMNVLVIIYLFVKFYRDTYMTKSKKN